MTATTSSATHPQKLEADNRALLLALKRLLSHFVREFSKIDARDISDESAAIMDQAIDAINQTERP